MGGTAHPLARLRAWAADPGKAGEVAARGDRLGDAAFVGPLKGMMPMYFMVGFRKGDHSALLVTFLVGSTSTMLMLDQLKALAAVVASRW
jgi:hypothetical protein